MDVSSIIASEQAKQNSVTVEKETPLELDPGLLAVTDLNPLDYETYENNQEEYLRAIARDGCQVLVAALFSLPVEKSADGPLARLPTPTTQLPRSKPLPKPKPPTKWERFAAAKGIQKKTRDRQVFDEERQEWVSRWGRDGKNREKEDAWLTELPSNADTDFDPIKAARDERKARVEKNEKQRLKNMERAGVAMPKDSRKREIEQTLATSRISTASMGKFDKNLEGEGKLRGIKRKFDANEKSAAEEKRQALELVAKLDGSHKRAKKGDGDVLNVRKAIRAVSKGKGSSALVKAHDMKRKGKGTKFKR